MEVSAVLEEVEISEEEVVAEVGSKERAVFQPVVETCILTMTLLEATAEQAQLFLCV